MKQNIALYPYFQFFRSLIFTQAIWFLFFESAVSASDALLLTAILDLSIVFLEVPSGYFSDYVGRRESLVIGALSGAFGYLILFGGNGFYTFAIAQVLLGAGNAFVSGSDNALLYDSLVEQNRQNEIAAQEARAWRFMFAGLAVSAIIGGFISANSFRPAYLLTAVSLTVTLGIAMAMQEPPLLGASEKAAKPVRQLMTILSRLKNRTLLWVLVFSVGSYALSHVPYVFAQPYLKEALNRAGYVSQTPAISGVITASMMIMSVIAGLFVMRVHKVIGTYGNLLLALTMQTGLIFALAYLLHPAALLLLVFRMIPNALSQPFVMELIQPRIESSYRATYLSVQNLLGRLLLSASVIYVAKSTLGAEHLDQGALQTILPWYGFSGLILLTILALTIGKTTSNDD